MEIQGQDVSAWHRKLVRRVLSCWDLIAVILMAGVIGMGIILIIWVTLV